MGFTNFEATPGYQAALRRLSDPATAAGMSGGDYIQTYGQQRPAGSGVGGAGGVGGGVPGGGVGLGIERITQLVNEINQRAQQSANAGRIPGGAALEQQSSGNIGSALRGEVDPSTINLLGQQAAERGAGTGSPLGPNSNADYMRSLGLTSLDRMNTGQGWLSAATARNPAAPIYDAGNQVLTAEQVQQAILAREQMANQIRIAQINNANRGRVGGGGSSPGGSSGRATGSAARPIGGGNYGDLFPGGGGGHQSNVVMGPTTVTGGYNYTQPGGNPAYQGDYTSAGGGYNAPYQVQSQPVQSQPIQPVQSQWNYYEPWMGDAYQDQVPAQSQSQPDVWNYDEPWLEGG
jgi:hypothetical protein